jgi:hypothetical protein
MVVCVNYDHYSMTQCTTYPVYKLIQGGPVNDGYTVGKIKLKFSMTGPFSST